ncbi:uncharacterized protein BDZ99DRAFT_489426 [Mytilinidion resinicola]|uniref:Uncharacterized protein n=1 Tax=Mytilinidion resinicola TaxID=574789 RepID=A0A6A6YIV3_9PEZI|nr:uncharacterized protein BDZ99DRAFT_489426 [Mytilinidion resinicola]KAF2807857.1 hypothetical protein BDZ99DRAFT_489426 [Mytilinidion resinicola]
MASAAIEARSLSNLTALASQPPRYPRNPTHERHEPLVLYIARVPGSRDVFLTPMKPMEKVVTAEDVQSCLYYLHIDQPEDAELLDDPVENQETGTEAPPPPPVHRKAVAPSNSHYNNNLLTPQQSPYPPSTNSPHVMQRKPLSTSPLAPRTVIDNRHESIQSNYPRPDARDDYRGRSADQTGSHNGEQLPILPPRRPSEQHPLPPRPPYPVDPSLRNDPYRSSQENYPPAFREPFPSRPIAQNSYGAQVSPAHNTLGPLSASPERPDTPNFFGASLTLIRRDPSSSSQWNVARIEDPPIVEVSSSSLNNPAVTQKSRRAGAPMYIEINNIGYSKFLNTSEGLPSAVVGDNGVSAKTLKDLANNMSAKSDNVPSETVFKRRLWMEGARHNDKSFGHRRLNSYDSSTGLDVPRKSSEGRYDERLSADYNRPPAPFQRRDDQAYATVQIPEKRSSSFRGYAFTSPWNGRCEFSTGGTGRSLKCKHIMSGGHQGAASSFPIAANVSELRFNLPSTSLLPSTPKGDDGSSKRSSFFRPRHGRHKSLQDDMSKLDLSLGQEQAGGGFGGKQAKLGKLIIEDEGLKMMDLLVAANMALYWRVYEKVDGKSRRADTSFDGY